MVLTVCTRPDGSYVLMPESAKAMQAASATHGPLEFCERIDSDEFPIPSIWGRVFAEIEENQFAVIQPAIGRQLLGIDCAGITDAA